MSRNAPGIPAFGAGAQWKLFGAAIALLLAFCTLNVFFEANVLAALALTTALSEWALGRLGVTWSASSRGASHRDRTASVQAARGLAIGLGIGGSLLLLTGVSAPFSFSIPSAPEVFIGALSALLLSIRSELFEHGLVREILGRDKTRSPHLRHLVLAAASVCFTYGLTRSQSVPILLATFSVGLISAHFWETEAAAFTAIGVRFGWNLMASLFARSVVASTATFPGLLSASILLVLGAGWVFRELRPSKRNALMAQGES
jgi:hypothetical protein